MIRATIGFTALALAAYAPAPPSASPRVLAPVSVVFVDDRDRWVGLSVWQDPETGCEYLVGPAGSSPVVRLGHDGRPRCGL